jgi:hypothetical protein
MGVDARAAVRAHRTLTMLRLSDYAGDPFEYTFDPSTGEYSRHRVHRRALTGLSGYASRERLKDPARGHATVLVAVYTDGQQLLLAIHNEVFTISEPGVQIRKEKPGLFSRHVQIVDQTRVLFDAIFSWSWLETSTWPAYGDIFDHAQWCMASRESVFRTIYSLQAVKEGRSRPDRAFRTELEQYVATRLAAERTTRPGE